MAIDKAIDSGKLDNALTATADAIRAKTGDAADIAFDFSGETGFADAVEAIPSGGGGDDLVAILEGTFSGAFVNNKITKTKTRAFASNPNMTSVSLPSCTNLGQRCFESCTNLESFNLPELTIAESWAFSGNGKNGSSIILPKLTTANGSGHMENSKFGVVVLPVISALMSSSFSGSSLLAAVDVGATNIYQNAFSNCNILSIVVLRSTGLVTLSNVSAFNNNTFKSGGSGGTIYIPKSLYDHLGDGTSLDYKSATNWSVIDGYGTITWAQIEGSIYETQYADGTPIT